MSKSRGHDGSAPPSAALGAIHLISASAGTGKTHRLVDELEHAITRESNPVRPEAVIATTFTVKAAAELRKSVRVHGALTSATGWSTIC